MYPSVFGYAATVFTFWWVVLGVWGVFTQGVELERALSGSVTILILSAMGAVMGVIGAITWLVLGRQAKRERLLSDNVRGLYCSIGPVPLNAKEPSRSRELPSFDGLPDIPANFFPEWLARYSETHPSHVALVKAMLKVYQHGKALPATHVVGGHGGRTLLQHSLLVAYQMQVLASKWSYTGLRDRTGKKVLLKLRDGSYEFDAQDPLILIVGLAHDIGKIEAFIFENGVIVGSHHEHDLTGARMMARMPEMWDIPDLDRVAILLSIAHYHHPMELPLSPDRRAIDDRTIAVMELLIKADFVASAIERKGVIPSEADYNSEMDQRESAELTDERLWTAFNEILCETGRINSADLNYNVGTICQVAGQNAMRLVLHEPSIRGALMRRLGIMESQQLGDGRHELTIRLLRLIDKNGLLVSSIRDLNYAAESAMWSVSFFGKKKTRGTNVAARLTGWPATIIMLPSVSSFVAGLPSYPWTCQVERGTMGDSRSKATKPGEPVTQVETPIATQPEAVESSSNDVQVDEADQVDHEAVETHPATREEPVDPEPSMPVEARKQHKRGREQLDLSVLDKARELMRPEPIEQAGEEAHEGHQMARGEVLDADVDTNPAFGDNGPVGPETSPPVELDEADVNPGLVVEAALEPRSFVVQASAQQQPEPQATAMSPYLLKHSVAKVIAAEAMAITETGGGRPIYLVSKLHLVKHVPDVNWSKASSDLISLCRSSRGSGFETIESGGDLYLLVDALMIKEFMERGRDD